MTWWLNTRDCRQPSANLDLKYQGWAKPVKRTVHDLNLKMMTNVQTKTFRQDLKWYNFGWICEARACYEVWTTWWLNTRDCRQPSANLDLKYQGWAKPVKRTVHDLNLKMMTNVQTKTFRQDLKWYNFGWICEARACYEVFVQTKKPTFWQNKTMYQK